MAFYLSRSLSATQAVNTYTACPGLAGDGSGPITVPQGVSHITRVRVSMGASAAITASTGGNVLLRLTGNGLRDGQQDIVSYGMNVGATMTNVAPVLADEFPTDIAVKPGNQITPSFAYTGADWGTPEFAVELCFE